MLALSTVLQNVCESARALVRYTPDCKRGNATKILSKSKNKLKGNFTTGSQEHFYLEGQAAFVIPKEPLEYVAILKFHHQNPHLDFKTYDH